MNTYKWKITALGTLPNPPAPIENCAILVQYVVMGINNENPLITVEINGSSEFTLPTTNENLIPYAELTEEQVLNWVQSEPNLVDSFYKNIDDQIDLLINALILPKITPLPWATE
jgi:hypothetical protein